MGIQDSIRLEPFANQALKPFGFINHQIWFWISLILFIILLIIISRNFIQRPKTLFDKSKELKESTKNNVSMSALMDNITKSGELYKQLSKMCHPDRFVNNPKQAVSEEIFKEVTRNKRNYQELVCLKNRAINELNINI